MYDEFSTGTVLVLERLSGIPLGSSQDRISELSTEQRAELADRLLGAVLRQVMVGGVFHSDLHPGNVLLSPDGELQLLDFGSVGRLDDGAREALDHAGALHRPWAPASAATDALMA